MKKFFTLAILLSAGLAYAQTDATISTGTTGTTTGTTTTGSTTTTTPAGSATGTSTMSTGSGTNMGGTSATSTTTVQSPSQPVQVVTSDADAPRSTLLRSGMLFFGGRVNIGLNDGTLGFEADSATQLSDVNGFTFGIAPRIGIFLSDRFAVGAYVSYDQSSATTKVSNRNIERKSSVFGAGAFLRYATGFNGNLYDGTHQLGWYTDLNLDYRNGTVTRTAQRDQPLSEFGVGLQPGLIWFPTPRIGLEASLGNLIRYTVQDLDIYGDADANQAGGDVTVGVRAKGSRLELLNLNTMGLKIGFNYYLNAGR